MSPYLMGIDIGLTKIKIGIMNEEGEVVATKSSTPATKCERPGSFEREPHVFWDSIKASIGEILRLSKISRERIECVGLCGHGDGLLILNKHKKPIRNAILSTDGRTLNIVQNWIRQKLHQEIVFPGMLVRLGNPPPLLLWLKRNEPANYREMRWLIFSKDWIKLKLTGTLCTDRTDISTVLLRGELSEEACALLKACELEEVCGRIPPIVEGHKICGHISRQAAEETGLKAGTPVVSGLIDFCACALGSGCLEDGDVYVSLGTWGANAVLRKKLVRDSKCNLSVRAVTFAVPDYWILTASTPGSAGSLDWFVQNFYRLTDGENDGNEFLYNKLDEEVSKIEPGSSGVIFHPYLYGTSLDQTRLGGVLGLRTVHEKAHLLRAIYEGVAFNHRAQIETLKETGIIRSIRLGGGGARSPEWSQIFAEVLGQDVLVPAEEPGIRGAVMAAGIGIGLYDDYVDAVGKLSRISRRHMPSKETTAIYEDQYKFFLKSVQVVSSLWNW